MKQAIGYNPYDPSLVREPLTQLSVRNVLMQIAALCGQHVHFERWRQRPLPMGALLQSVQGLLYAN